MDNYIGFAELCNDRECDQSVYETILDRLNDGFVFVDKLDHRHRLDRLTEDNGISEKCNNNECSLTSIDTKRNTLNRMGPSGLVKRDDSLNRLNPYPLVKRESLDRLIGMPLEKRDSQEGLNRVPLMKRESLDRLIGFPIKKRDSMDRLNMTPLAKRESLDRLIGIPLEKRDSLDRLNKAPLVKRDSLDNTNHIATSKYKQDNRLNRLSGSHSMIPKSVRDNDIQNMIDLLGTDSTLLVHQSLQGQRQPKSNYRLHRLTDFALFDDNQDYYDVNDCISCSSIESTSF